MIINCLSLALIEQVLEGLLEEDESCLEVWYLLALAQYAGGAPDIAKDTLQTLEGLLAKPGAIAPTDDPPDLDDLKVTSGIQDFHRDLSLVRGQLLHSCMLGCLGPNIFYACSVNIFQLLVLCSLETKISFHPILLLTSSEQCLVAPR